MIERRMRHILSPTSVAVAAMGLLLLVSSTAMADTNTSDDMTAEGEVIQEISLNILSSLDFGTIARPNDGTATLTIDPNDDSAGVSGGTGANHYEDHDLGRFEITGEADRNVQFSSTISDFSDSGLTFTDALYTESENTNIDLGTEGSVTVDVGGDFEVGTEAATQVHNDATLTIDVWYD